MSLMLSASPATNLARKNFIIYVWTHLNQMAAGPAYALPASDHFFVASSSAWKSFFFGLWSAPPFIKQLTWIMSRLE